MLGTDLGNAEVSRAATGRGEDDRWRQTKPGATRLRMRHAPPPSGAKASEGTARRDRMRGAEGVSRRMQVARVEQKVLLESLSPKFLGGLFSS